MTVLGPIASAGEPADAGPEPLRTHSPTVSMLGGGFGGFGHNTPGMIDGREPPRLKAKKYVELLLAESGDAVLAGEAAQMGEQRLPYDYLMDFTADALECFAAFGGLAEKVRTAHGTRHGSFPPRHSSVRC